MTAATINIVMAKRWCPCVVGNKRGNCIKIGQARYFHKTAEAAPAMTESDAKMAVAVRSRRVKAGVAMKKGKGAEETDQAKPRRRNLRDRLVHHRADGCNASPVAGAQSLERSLERARSHELRIFDGGDAPRSGPCGPLSYHGFAGLDAAVVDSIVAYLRAH